MTRSTNKKLPPASPDIPSSGRAAPARRPRRDRDAIAKAMQAEAHTAAHELGLAAAGNADLRCHGTVPDDGTLGLSLRALVERRWKVAPQTAAAQLKAAGLPVDGRRARVIYSWSSIWLAEEVDIDIAAIATRETHPELFDDLIKPDEAAERLGVRSEATIRKMVISGIIRRQAYVAFGSRPIRLYRPAFIEAERVRRLQGRLV